MCSYVINTVVSTTAANELDTMGAMYLHPNAGSGGGDGGRPRSTPSSR